MKSKILLVTSIYPPQSGGPAIFTSRFADWITKNNFSPKIVTYCNEKTPNIDNISYISLKPNRFVAFLIFIFSIIKNSSKDTLILSNGAFIETYIASLISRRKYVIKIPGDHVWELSRNRGWTNKNIEEFQVETLNSVQKVFRILINLSLRKATSIISPSNQLSDLAKLWGVKTHRINTIYNCVDAQRFNKVDLPNSNYDLVSVCRLVPWKGLEELIECSIDLNLKLIIIGDGPLMESLQKLANRSPKNIHLVGNVKNEKVVEYLNQAKIFVLNSEYEATSYALIEAKMCGLPILAKATDGSITLVQNNIDGLVYSPKSNTDLKGSIEKLLFNNDLIKSFGVAARKDALLRFNQDINFRQILKVIES